MIQQAMATDTNNQETVEAILEDAKSVLNQNPRFSTLSKLTHKAYFADYAQLAEWLVAKNLDFKTAQTGDLLDYFNTLKNTGDYTASTLHRKLAAAKSLFKILKKSGYRTDHPMINMNPKKLFGHVTTKEIKLLTAEQLTSLFNVIQSQEKLNRARRDAAITGVMFFGLAKASEASLLLVSDYNDAATSLGNQPPTLKIRKRLVRVSADLKNLLDDNIRTLQLQEGPLFPSIGGPQSGEKMSPRSIRRNLQTYMQKADIDPNKYCSNSVRLSGIVNQLSQGKSVRDIFSDAHLCPPTPNNIASSNIGRMKMLLDEGLIAPILDKDICL